jgi:uncharacterized glyoxalase superfamily protein PhnB
MQTIVPILRYDDARRAIRFLCDAFGFVELFSIPESGAFVRHARLQLGGDQIMLGSVRDDEGITGSPALFVDIDDVDAHCERARAAGAEIVSEPHDTEFGSRQYAARDVEGHNWVFGRLV